MAEGVKDVEAWRRSSEVAKRSLTSGDFVKAEEEYRGLLGKVCKVHHPNDVNVLRTKCYLAQALTGLEQEREADDLERQLLRSGWDIASDSTDSRDVMEDVLIMRLERATSLFGKRDYQGAAAVLREARDFSKRWLEPEHAIAVKIKDHLSNTRNWIKLEEKKRAHREEAKQAKQIKREEKARKLERDKASLEELEKANEEREIQKLERERAARKELEKASQEGTFQKLDGEKAARNEEQKAYRERLGRLMLDPSAKEQIELARIEKEKQKGDERRGKGRAKPEETEQPRQEDIHKDQTTHAENDRPMQEPKDTEKEEAAQAKPIADLPFLHVPKGT